jgi:hypothetical protein
MVVMPISCLAGSVAVWLDPAERSGFWQSLMNNGVTLYLLALVPCAVLSFLHTKLTAHAARFGPSQVLLSIVLGFLMALIIGVVVVGGLNLQMWPLLLWGSGTGALYVAALRVTSVVRTHGRREQ